MSPEASGANSRLYLHIRYSCLSTRNKILFSLSSELITIFHCCSGAVPSHPRVCLASPCLHANWHIIMPSKNPIDWKQGQSSITCEESFITNWRTWSLGPAPCGQLSFKGWLALTNRPPDRIHQSIRLCLPSVLSLASSYINNPPPLLPFFDQSQRNFISSSLPYLLTYKHNTHTSLPHS